VLVIVKRNGAVEKWDVRTNSTQPVMQVKVPGGANVMDMEICPAHGLILVAAGKKVCVRLRADTLA
jgi:hypothetical protein